MEKKSDATEKDVTKPHEWEEVEASTWQQEQQRHDLTTHEGRRHRLLQYLNSLNEYSRDIRANDELSGDLNRLGVLVEEGANFTDEELTRESMIILMRSNAESVLEHEGEEVDRTLQNEQATFLKQSKLLETECASIEDELNKPGARENLEDLLPIINNDTGFLRKQIPALKQLRQAIWDELQINAPQLNQLAPNATRHPANQLRVINETSSALIRHLQSERDSIERNVVVPPSIRVAIETIRTLDQLLQRRVDQIRQLQTDNSPQRVNDLFEQLNASQGYLGYFERFTSGNQENIEDLEKTCRTLTEHGVSSRAVIFSALAATAQEAVDTCLSYGEGLQQVRRQLRREIDAAHAESSQQTREEPSETAIEVTPSTPSAVPAEENSSSSQQEPSNPTRQPPQRRWGGRLGGIAHFINKRIRGFPVSVPPLPIEPIQELYAKDARRTILDLHGRINGVPNKSTSMAPISEKERITGTNFTNPPTTFHVEPFEKYLSDLKEGSFIVRLPPTELATYSRGTAPENLYLPLALADGTPRLSNHGQTVLSLDDTSPHLKTLRSLQKDKKLLPGQLCAVTYTDHQVRFSPVKPKQEQSSPNKSEDSIHNKQPKRK